MDLQQFHVWNDTWADDDEWQRAVADLKDEGLVRAIGISINRWQPANVLKALATDLIDAVQVVYNVFDQAPEDELFAECQRRNIAVIARVPFDEGSLTDTLTPDTTWPEGDFRNIYFQPETCATRSSASQRCVRWSRPACPCRSWRCGTSSSIRPSAP